MNTLLRQSINPLRSSRPLRQFATALPRRREAYVPTINNIIPPSNTIQISALVPAGFHLSNDVVIPGAAILLSGRAYLWNVELPTKEDDGGVRAWAGWGPDAFRVFEAVAPRPELLILGTGPTVLPPPPFLTSYMNSLGIQLDVMNSRDAASTYNLLTEEGRPVSCCILPQRPVDIRTGQFQD